MRFQKLGRLGGAQKPRTSPEMSLQITSMADVFTILLVFLLKSSATGALNVTPSAGLLLPQAQASEANVEAVKIEIQETTIQVEGVPVTTLSSFLPDGSDRVQDGSLRSLASALERERKRQILIAEKNPGVKVDSRILVLADQRAPYSLIKSALASAALQGFTDFKLAVVQGD